jgi:hypothetical protein
MADPLIHLVEKVTDETSFLVFLKAFRENCEREQGCRRGLSEDHEDHWETHSTLDFLRSAEDWAANGDFAEGQHYGEPMLRRVATMLYVGKYYSSPRTTNVSDAT